MSRRMNATNVCCCEVTMTCLCGKVPMQSSGRFRGGVAPDEGEFSGKVISPENLAGRAITAQIKGETAQISLE